MFKQKRGINQIDWSISLGIFLIYIAWFFVIVKPQVIDAGVFAPNSEGLIYGFENLTTHTINEIPLFVTSYSNHNNRLLEIDASKFSNQNYGFVTNRPYLIEDDIIYLVDDITNSTKIYYLIESVNISFLQNNYIDQGIFEGNGSVNPNSNITAYFSSEIDSIYYDNNPSIDKITYYQNGQELTPTNFTFENKLLFGSFFTTFDAFSIEDKMIAGSNTIQSRIKKIDKINDINISLQFDLNNFTEYYINNDDYGIIDDLDNECIISNDKSLKLIDDTKGLYFIFNKKIDISVCNYENSIVSFNFSNQNIKYYFGYNDNNLSSIPSFDEDYSIDWGFGSKSEYPLISKIKNLSSNDLDISGINGFRLSVYNTTSDETSTRASNILKMIHQGTNSTNNLYSKDKVIVVQDNNGKQWRMILNVKVW